MPDKQIELSPRELEIACLAGDGENVRDIAAGLCISANTVKTHLEHVYERLHVRNRAELVHALENYAKNHPNG
jgi:DNA-binding NarL/FixJ family response regulator